MTLCGDSGSATDVTFGRDVGSTEAGDDNRIVFAQFPVYQAPESWRIAAQLGLGTIGSERVLRPGLSVGRGTKNRHGYGWQAADLAFEFRPDLGSVHRKMDLTWGIARPKGRRWILQVQAGKQDADPFYARLVPSLVQPVTNRIHAQFGVTYGLTGEDTFGAVSGLWLEF